MAVLDCDGLVNRLARPRTRAEGTPLSQGLQPNDLWCVDYKGEFQLGDKRCCYPLTVTDHASRYLLLCEALAMQCPAQLYSASATPYIGIPEPHYPFHDKAVLVTCCGRLCLPRKKINLSKLLAGQAGGVQEVEDDIWLVSFMDYDLGDVDLEEKTL